MSDSLALEQTPWQSMFLRLLAETERRDKPKWDQAESHLRAAVYHDPHRHQSELAKLFRRFPLCLGHVDQFPEPGSMLAREIIGMPLLLIRDAAGSIGVFLNAC